MKPINTLILKFLFVFLCFVSLSRKCKTHPGPVVHISGNPVDPNKVVEFFSSCD